MCREWQAAADPAVDAGARVCFLRTAPVMDRRAAPLKQLRLLTKLGLGARLGDGRQRMAMISLRDWVGGGRHLVEHDAVTGPVNLCSPQTPTNAEFTEALAQAVDRKAFLVAPRLRRRARRRADGPRGARLDQPAPDGPRGLPATPSRDRTVHEVVRTGLS